MNDENDIPLHPSADEVVEARIVAWVLGEASAFEIAELERLCAEKPELAAFHQRMLALQGLLGETVGYESGDEWKLPEAKAKTIHEAFGEVPFEVVVEKKKRPLWKRPQPWIGVAACLAVSTVVWRYNYQDEKSEEIARTPLALPAARSYERELEALSRAIMDQEDKVEERRKTLSNIVREKGIIYTGDESIFRSSPEDLAAVQDGLKGNKRDEAMKRGIDTQDYAQAKQDFQQDLEILQKLKLDLIQRKVKAQSAQETTSDYVAKNLRFHAGSSLDSDGMTGGMRSSDAEIARNDVSKLLEEIPEAPASPAASAPVTASPAVTAKPREARTRTVPPQKPASAFNSTNFERGNSPELPVAGGLFGKAEKSKKAPVGLQGVIPPQGDPNEVTVSRKQALLELPEDSASTAAPARDMYGQERSEVRGALYKAEGNYNLGKYDEAKKDYEAALRADPYNSAARRGLERLAAAKSDYYRAAYDHTGAGLLTEVDKAWELNVPSPAQAPGEPDPFSDKPSSSFVLPTSPDAKKRDADGIGTGMGYSLEDGMNGGDALAKTLDLKDLPADGFAYQLQDEGLKSEAAQDLIQAPADPFAPGEQDASKLSVRGKVSNYGIKVDLNEITTAEEAFSTFSLNVSDVSFQLALASLEKSESPDPASIKVEQFYNAVDYGDPAPSGDPIATKIEQSAHPVIPGRNLVRLGVKTASAGRSAAQPLNLTLLIDQSGSMVRDDRRAALEKALADLSTLLTEKDRVSVIGFSRTPSLLADGIAGNQLGAVTGMMNREAAEAGTNLEEALSLASQIALRQVSHEAGNRIVLFTDGAANLGDADPARLAEKVRTLRQEGVAFDVAGIGADGLNDKLLAELARNGDGRYLLAAGNIAAQLAGAFRPAAEDVKVQVRFNPERVSRYKLIGFEEDRLKKEDFRNDAVDAAELAAEEAAVALYQIELIPDGKGEIGEMSVRFRDAASGEMVERSWTIAHDTNTPVFDKATPSMQLAGLSMLAGEKLKGGPMAPMIDFRKYNGGIASVRQYYANSSKVADMLRMIGLLAR